MPDIHLQNITKRYIDFSGDNQGFVLQEFDLTLRAGEFFALLGPSGSGKTTLLKLVAGLLAPDSGDIYWGSRRITMVPAEKRDFSMVFQQPLLFPHLTVMENVAFGLKMQGITKSRRFQAAREMLAAVGLAGYEYRRPAGLSGGQQQRVALARALVTKPGLLLMDEPFSSLDPGLRVEMRQLVAAMHQQHHVTVLFVTHDQDEAFQLAERMGVLAGGVLLQVGNPRELYERPLSAAVAAFLGANMIWGELEHEHFRSGNLKITFPTGQARISGPGWLVLRPEIIQVAPATTNCNLSMSHTGHIYGTIRQQSYRQGFYHLKVEVQCHQIQVIQRAEAVFEPVVNTPVKLSYDFSQLWFIPEENTVHKTKGISLLFAKE